MKATRYFNYISLVVTFSIPLFFSSCTKQNVPLPYIEMVYDTIKPNDYFPVYPGSWWKYCINDTGFQINRVSDDYRLHCYITRWEWDGNTYSPVYTDSVYVPFLDSEPIYGYDKIDNDSPITPTSEFRWPILSEQIGYTFDYEYDYGKWGDCVEHMKVVEKTVLNSDSVVIIKGNRGYCNLDERHLEESYRVYSKFIGLTSHCVIDTSTCDTLYKKVLVACFINH